MNIFPRKAKKTSGAYYFGEFNETPRPPFSVSLAEFGLDYTGEPVHYHQQNQKVYIVLEGAGVLNVDGKEVPMSPETMIHVEPGERHFVARVTKAPLKFAVILSSKTDDKVVGE